MSAIARAYTFTDGTDAYGSQVESEFNTIFNAWNNHDAGTSSWTQVKTGILTSTGVTTLKGSATNDSAAAGNIGEVLSSAVTSLTSFPASTSYGDLTSVSLTAGDWDVTVKVDQDNNGGTVIYWGAGVWDAAGNDSTGQLTGQNFGFATPSSTNDTFMCVANVRVSLAATTTYYLKYVSQYTVATPKARGIIIARRCR